MSQGTAGRPHPSSCVLYIPIDTLYAEQLQVLLSLWQEMIREITLIRLQEIWDGFA